MSIYGANNLLSRKLSRAGILFSPMNIKQSCFDTFFNKAISLYFKLVPNAFYINMTLFYLFYINKK